MMMKFVGVSDYNPVGNATAIDSVFAIAHLLEQQFVQPMKARRLDLNQWRA
jgi:hypothetical protein